MGGRITQGRRWTRRGVGVLLAVGLGGAASRGRRRGGDPQLPVGAGAAGGGICRAVGAGDAVSQSAAVHFRTDHRKYRPGGSGPCRRGSRSGGDAPDGAGGGDAAVCGDGVSRPDVRAATVRGWVTAGASADRAGDRFYGTVGCSGGAGAGRDRDAGTVGVYRRSGIGGRRLQQSINEAQKAATLTRTKLAAGRATVVAEVDTRQAVLRIEHDVLDTRLRLAIARIDLLRLLAALGPDG